MTRLVRHDSDMHQAVDRETAGGRSVTEWTARIGSGRTPLPALGRMARNRLAPLWLAALMGAVFFCFFLVPPTVPQAQARSDIEVWSTTLTVAEVTQRGLGPLGYYCRRSCSSSYDLTLEGASVSVSTASP